MTQTLTQRNLTTPEGREAAYQNLCQNAVDALRAIIPLAVDAVCEIDQYCLQLGLKSDSPDHTFLWASDLRIDRASSSTMNPKPTRIAIAACGAFTPAEKAQYWRIIHASLILQNWERVSELVESFCQQYDEQLGATQKTATQA